VITTRGIVATIAAMIGVCACAKAPRTAVIHWKAPTVYSDGSPIAEAITYNVYEGAKGAELQVSTRVSGTTYTASSGLDASSTVCFQITAVVNDRESLRSKEACKSFP
jgi:Tfp pilus assembly protein PilX